MKTVKLEDLKKELGDLFEDTIEEVVEEIVDNYVPIPATEEHTQEISANTVSDGGVFIAELHDNGEDILSEEENIENGESQEIQKKETDKPTSKFKSVEELEKAYSSLEKEFTKRCQRLKELEKEVDKVKVETPEQWKAKVDKFFVETPDAKSFAREMADEIGRDSTLRARQDCLEVALARVLMSKYRSPKELASDEEFLREHILGSDFVKKAVIDRYMKDLRDGKPPVLMSKGGQNTVAPRNKPKTIADAGRLFQQNNR